MTDILDQQPDGAVKININRRVIEGESGWIPGQQSSSTSEMYKPSWGYGPGLGWNETNVGFGPTDFFGSIDQPGLLFQMRHNYDVVASIMEFRKNAVAGLKYSICARNENPTRNQLLAAEAVGMMLERQVGGNLNSFISETYDLVATYGFNLYEIWIPDTGPSANRLHLQTIPAQSINWWDYVPDNREEIRGVEISSGDSLINIPGGKLAWFGHQTVPGNFWGMSELRKVLSLFLMMQEDTKNYLALRRLQKGILYFKENEEGSTTASWEIARNFLLQYFNGRSSPLIIPRGMDIDHLSADSPGLEGYKAMFEYVDAKVKAALDSSLNNLGISGVGSLALGKEISIADREKFVAHVDNFMRVINDPQVANCNLLAKLTGLLGFDPQTDTPQIKVVNNVAVRLSDTVDSVIKLLDANVISAQDITDETRLQLFEELGLDTSRIEQRALAEYTSSMSESAAASVSYLAADPIDMYPTDAMVEAAARGLKIRESLPPSRRGGTAVGLARARDIANRRRLSLETWKRIFSFVSRHKPVWEEQKSKLPPGEFTETKSNQAMLLWGGIDAINKAERVMKAHDALNKTE